jgi:hypothetical protein
MKFLGLQIYNHRYWTVHIDKLISKLSRLCYAVRSVFNISNTDTIKSVCFVYFRTIMKYGIIVWGNSSNTRRYSL